MRGSCTLWLAYRTILGALLAYVIFVQALAGAVSGAAMAAHKALGLDQLSVICSSDGPQRIDTNGAQEQPHAGRSDCCAWACAGKFADISSPEPTSCLEIKPEVQNHCIITRWIANMRVPRSGLPRTQAARAPPSLQS